MNGVEIWTDGGCHGNPGPGGWAYVVVELDESGGRRVVDEQWGAEPSTTNNRMELSAVIAALDAVNGRYADDRRGPLTVITDSAYVKNGITVWIHDWKNKGWRTAAKKPVKNQDLWQRLDTLAGTLSVRWQWVRGHSGHEFNERCDRLTQKAIESLPR